MTVVAISRQVGSQGEKVAEFAAKNLGLKNISRQHIKEFTIQCDPELGRACAMFEKEVPKSFWARHFFDSAKNAALFEWLTFKLASQGNVILIGRGTPVVLKNRPDTLRVRIVAPIEQRIQRIQRARNISHEEAKHFVNNYGRLRRNLIESIFKIDLSNSNLYDLQINTHQLSAESAAEILATAIQAKSKSVDEKKSRKSLTWEALIKEVKVNIKKELNPGLWQQIDAESGEEGLVVITGFVNSQQLHDRAEELALGVQGIEKVDNRIVVMDMDESPDD